MRDDMDAHHDADFDYRDPFAVRSLENPALDARRAPRDVILRQQQILKECPTLTLVMDNVPEMIMVLNDQRQLIFGNKALLSAVEAVDLDPFLGQRPGDVLGCVHATRSTDGCGTTQFCRHCGAFKVLLGNLDGRPHSEECRITRQVRGWTEAVDLRVSTAPLKISGHGFIFFHITDISLEKRKLVLERIFFHDISNAVGMIMGVLELTVEHVEGRNKELLNLALRQTRSVVDEIQGQKALNAAESHELGINPQNTNSLDILLHLSRTYASHVAGKDKHIRVSDKAEPTSLRTDVTLLGRVLGNMVKNALEASAPGDEVEIGAVARDGKIVFWVHNTQVIPEDVQLQIFKRSFSTKSKGRGLGTYSIKLLAEEYLRGKAWFVSDRDHGTVFYVELPLGVEQQEGVELRENME